jgi:hypothetical protein
MFAIGFSNKAAYPFRVGIASFLPEVRNEVKYHSNTGLNYSAKLRKESCQEA